MDAKSNEQKYDEKSVPSQSIFSQDTNYKGENSNFNNQVIKVNITKIRHIGIMYPLIRHTEKETMSLFPKNA